MCSHVQINSSMLFYDLFYNFVAFYRPPTLFTKKLTFFLVFSKNQRKMRQSRTSPFLEAVFVRRNFSKNKFLFFEILRAYASVQKPL